MNDKLRNRRSTSRFGPVAHDQTNSVGPCLYIYPKKWPTDGAIALKSFVVVGDTWTVCETAINSFTNMYNLDWSQAIISPPWCGNLICKNVTLSNFLVEMFILIQRYRVH